MPRQPLLFLLAVLPVLSSACGDKIDPMTVAPPPGNGNGNEVVSYVTDVKAILDSYCIFCHSSGKQGADRLGAPLNVNLNTYEGAVASSAAANSRIQNGTMPPIGARPSAAERALFQQWIDQGMLRQEAQ